MIKNENNSLKIVKKETIGRFSYISYLIFLLSPFLSLPFILIGIYKRERGSLLALSMVMGILTYLLLPDWTLDIARYYQRYDMLREFSFKEFVFYLENYTSDYVFYFLMFLFGKLNIKFQILLFLLSTFNFYVFLSFYKKIFYGNIKYDYNYFSNFLFYILSIGILHYLSATRYVLANSFFLIYIYQYFFEKKKTKGILFYIMSVLTHTAFLIYVPFLMVIPKIKNKKATIIISGIIFVLFFFLPIDSILIQLSSFLPGFSEKAIIYSNLERESNWAPTLSHFLVFLGSWFFLIIYYKKVPTLMLNILLSLLIPVLISIPFGYVVYDRFMIAFKPILFICLIYCSFIQLSSNNKLNSLLIKRLLMFSCILYVTYSIYLYRYNIAPYFRLDNMLLVNILNTKYSLSDIFDL